jgi:protein transport protein SEC61 subunit gamma-like protein
LFAEFKDIAFKTGMGMVVMGFVGFFVKLVHIPINNILMGI